MPAKQKVQPIHRVQMLMPTYESLLYTGYNETQVRHFLANCEAVRVSDLLDDGELVVKVDQIGADVQYRLSPGKACILKHGQVVVCIDADDLNNRDIWIKRRRKKSK